MGNWAQQQLSNQWRGLKSRNTAVLLSVSLEIYSFWLDFLWTDTQPKPHNTDNSNLYLCWNNRASLCCKKHCHHPVEWEAPQPRLLETNNGKQPHFRSVGVLPSLSNPLLNTEPKLLSDAYSLCISFSKCTRKRSYSQHRTEAQKENTLCF